MPTVNDRIWAAGYLDGHCSISMSMGKVNPTCVLVISTVEPKENCALRQALGQPNLRASKADKILYYSGERMLWVLGAVIPHMRAKAENAMFAHAYVAHMITRRTGVRDALPDVYRSLANYLSAFNRSAKVRDEYMRVASATHTFEQCLEFAKEHMRRYYAALESLTNPIAPKFS